MHKSCSFYLCKDSVAELRKFISAGMENLGTGLRMVPNCCSSSPHRLKSTRNIHNFQFSSRSLLHHLNHRDPFVPFLGGSEEEWSMRLYDSKRQPSHLLVFITVEMVSKRSAAEETATRAVDARCVKLSSSSQFPRSMSSTQKNSTYPPIEFFAANSVLASISAWSYLRKLSVILFLSSLSISFACCSFIYFKAFYLTDSSKSASHLSHRQRRALSSRALQTIVGRASP